MAQLLVSNLPPDYSDDQCLNWLGVKRNEIIEISGKFGHFEILFKDVEDAKDVQNSRGDGEIVNGLRIIVKRQSYQPPPPPPVEAPTEEEKKEEVKQEDPTPVTTNVAEFLEKEMEYLTRVEDYQNDVESRLSEIKDKICEKIDELMAAKCNTAAGVAASIQENIDQLEEGNAASRRTESLSYDLETSVSEKVDAFLASFVDAVGTQFDLEHKVVG